MMETNPKKMTSSTQSEKKPSYYLDGQINLTLHTKLSQSLLAGDWLYGRLGLWQFAPKIRDLWKAHRADDPYADWFFMKIDEKIHRIRTEILEIEQYCTQQLSQLRGLNIQIFESPKPMQLALKFAIPFSYMGASLLAELDFISRQAYTLRHMGQLLQPEKLPLKVVSSIRQLFSIPLDWKTPVTRQDIRDNNPIAQEAKEKMGAIPEVILNKELKFLFLLDTMLGSIHAPKTMDALNN